MPEYDAIIVGTGQSGPALAHRLTGAGMRVAIVERHRFGGTCVNPGCTPTKTLVASAYAAHLVRRGAEFGVVIGGPVTVSRVSGRILAYNPYTDPPLGGVGMTEAEVRKSWKAALMATYAMEDVSRAFEKGEMQGFMKILVDRDSRQILSASILGVGGDAEYASVFHRAARPNRIVAAP
jgi:pyruvate/2-oxoglutarate dehydrogenase complex dihydrolipoamide dehydrogenase (E3) component